MDFSKSVELSTFIVVGLRLEFVLFILIFCFLTPSLPLSFFRLDFLFNSLQLLCSSYAAKTCQIKFFVFHQSNYGHKE